ncbi:hypothetical protein PIECOFPK_01071 [Mycovorax composti]|jgi:hypothetical protein|uniref:Uncharacterized protein n=2 Tax=Chitinophagaceae TaxID=563835 RepID=A0ABZ2EJB2_9BACT
MIKRLVLFLAFLITQYTVLLAQCSICTKTAQQLGEGPARGMNTGIIYLAFLPLIVMTIIGIRWWKNEKAKSESFK